jgi:hypothetical protein
MDSHILDLADAHSQHWIHRVGPARNSSIFLEVESKAPAEELTVDFATSIAAQFCLGWNDATLREDDDPDGPTHLSGFTASVFESNGKGHGERRVRLIWERAYPMDRVRIPAFLREGNREE